MIKSIRNGIRARELRSKLLSAGWTYREREYLIWFLNIHPPTLADLAEEDIKHLEFLRYLVQTGRMVD